MYSFHSYGVDKGNGDDVATDACTLGCSVCRGAKKHKYCEDADPEIPVCQITCFECVSWFGSERSSGADREESDYEQDKGHGVAE